MAYKLVIVDDEEIIRKSLRNLVAWDSIGFEVVALFGDGRDVLEYIKTNPVDVVLTDIKMPHLSGVDVARYVHENGLPITVVLLSGYKEFSYAKKALEYQVAHFIIKPLDLDELKDIFIKVFAALEEKQTSQRQIVADKQRILEMSHVLEEQFYLDLVMGAIPDKAGLQKKISRYNLCIEPTQTGLALVTATINDRGRGIAKSWRYDPDSLITAIDNIINFKPEESKFFFLEHSTPKLELALVLKKVREGDGREELASRLVTTRKNIEKMLDIGIRFDIKEYFHNLYSIIDRSVLATGGAEGGAFAHNAQAALNEQKKLFFSCVSRGSTKDASNILRKTLNELYITDAQHMKEYSSSIGQLFLELYPSMGLDHIVKALHKTLCECDIEPNITDKVMGHIDAALRRFEKNAEESERKIIRAVKSYALEHLHEDVTLSAIAEVVYLNAVYLSRLFINETGGSFTNYLTQIRIAKAKELLIDPKIKVYEVSRQVGYSSVKHFHKIFKRSVGMTPAEYREKNAVWQK